METEADTDELAVHRELSIAREGFWRGRHGQSSCPEGVASRHRVFQIRVQIEVTMKVDKLGPHRVNSASRLRHPATPPPRERPAETPRHSPPPDRTRAVTGKSVSVRLVPCVRRITKQHK